MLSSADEKTNFCFISLYEEQGGNHYPGYLQIKKSGKNQIDIYKQTML